jgi:hypothetical protein
MLDLALDDTDTPTAVIVRALFDRMGEGIENTRRFQRGVFREIARLQLGFDEGGPAQQVDEQNRTRLVKLFGRAQERGEFGRGNDPETLARSFTHLVNGTITDWLFEADGGSLRERMRSAAEVFLGPVAESAAATRDVPLPELFPARPWSWNP